MSSTCRDLAPGTRFGHWTVIRDRGPSRHRMAECRCDCGHISDVSIGNMRAGVSTRCRNCRRMPHHRPTTHGMSKTAEYGIWVGMRARCSPMSRKALCLRNYSQRGIRVCERWEVSFENFFADMGPRPSPKHSIDRVDNNGHYEPSNCRWATAHEQHQNTRAVHRITVGKETLCASEWARRNGIKVKTVQKRLRDGWDPAKAVSHPLLRKRIGAATDGAV